MKPTHSPTPAWHVGTKQAHHVVYDAQGWLIADCSPFGKSEETLANAKLIALAPEMLAALQAVEAWTAEVPSPYRDFPFVQAARAVLAKL